ncbi:MAG: HAD family hydrolase [Planctomycetes bacterium]|nr:HAD family hydrolase [Planctomycetota bacterium]
MTKAVFLDRDGTLNYEIKGDLTRPAQLRLYKNVPEALKLLRQAGYKLIVVTNQSLIARGLIPETGLHLIHRKLKGLLAKNGVRLDGIYYCPHHPTRGTVKRFTKACDCRKPEPGMLKKAIRDFRVDPKQSFFIGDTRRDMGAARKMRIRFILLLTGYGRKTLKEINRKEPAFISGSLLKACKFVVSEFQ